MTNFFEVVNLITFLDNEREKVVKKRASEQKTLESLFSQYMFCLIHGMKPLLIIYADLIKRGSAAVIPSLDMAIETLEKNSKMLKALIVTKASPEELEKGLREVDKNLDELNKKTKELFDKFPE